MRRMTVLFAFLTALMLVPAATPADAQELDRYQARLSGADHFNSRGQRLRSAAAIIRQDRANVYVFGKVDPEDQGDSYFSNKANRARMEQMLRNGSADPGVIDAIVNGTPLIEVVVYPNAVEVFLLSY